MTLSAAYIRENDAITKAVKRKWLWIILAIKLCLFVYWAWHFQHYTRPELISSGIAIEMPDTDSYYTPLDQWISSGEYPTMCRMPGFAPVYYPLQIVLGKKGAYLGIIILQFIASVISVLLLAIIASRIIPWKYSFHITAILYSISSFVSIWDHTLLSDSFSTSFLLFGIYSFTNHLLNGKNTSLLVAGLWLTWAVFIRQVIVLAFPVGAFILLLIYRKTFLQLVLKMSVFAACFLLFDGWWTLRNYNKEKVLIPLVKPITSCWSTYTPEFMKLNDLQITWGEDVQYWIAGSSADWFTQQKIQTKPFPFRTGIFTSICNSDSLLLLQNDYATSRIDPDSSIRARASERFLLKCERYKQAYIRENRLDYYVTKRFKMFAQFVFPLRHDNLPGPAFSQMNFIQKIVKSGYLFLLLFINALALAGVVLAIFRKNKTMILFCLLPAGITIFLSMILGYIEQRYYVPVYPLAVVLAVWTMSLFIPRWIKKAN